MSSGLPHLERYYIMFPCQELSSFLAWNLPPTCFVLFTPWSSAGWFGGSCLCLFPVEHHLATNVQRNRLVQHDLQVAKQLQEEEDLKARAQIQKHRKDLWVWGGAVEMLVWCDQSTEISCFDLSWLTVRGAWVDQPFAFVSFFVWLSVALKVLVLSTGTKQWERGGSRWCWGPSWLGFCCLTMGRSLPVLLPDGGVG